MNIFHTIETCFCYVECNSKYLPDCAHNLPESEFEFFKFFFKEDNEEIEVLDMGEKLGKTHAVRAQFHSAA